MFVYVIKLIKDIALKEKLLCGARLHSLSSAGIEASDEVDGGGESAK